MFAQGVDIDAVHENSGRVLKAHPLRCLGIFRLGDPQPIGLHQALLHQLLEVVQRLGGMWTSGQILEFDHALPFWL